MRYERPCEKLLELGRSQARPLRSRRSSRGKGRAAGKEAAGAAYASFDLTSRSLYRRAAENLRGTHQERSRQQMEVAAAAQVAA